ncbi:hypothetical protein J6590_011263 [Homalodisca vitripennis]|nr:hypothetical protein J6590_011263 [Homalodisca vitripennis]
MVTARLQWELGTTERRTLGHMGPRWVDAPQLSHMARPDRFSPHFLNSDLACIITLPRRRSPRYHLLYPTEVLCRRGKTPWKPGSNFQNTHNRLWDKIRWLGIVKKQITPARDSPRCMNSLCTEYTQQIVG